MAETEYEWEYSSFYFIDLSTASRRLELLRVTKPEV